MTRQELVNELAVLLRNVDSAWLDTVFREAIAAVSEKVWTRFSDQEPTVGDWIICYGHGCQWITFYMPTKDEPIPTHPHSTSLVATHWATKLADPEE